MDRLKIIETKKLFKELEYFELELEYKNQIVSTADSDFIKSVNEFLDENKELKELFDSKINAKIEETLKNKSVLEESVETEEETEEEETEEEVIRSKKIKKFYREVAKLTHPDKTDDEWSKDLYIKATKYYEENDLIAMYSVCAELKIDFELDEVDNALIKIKISNIKERIEFMEKTFTWKWYHMENEMDKKNLILSYVKTKLNN
jgi:hypothetical protein